MRRIFFLLAALSSQATADPLHVHSEVKDFALAEEASYLLQCLREEHGAELRFVSSAAPRPLLSLQEKKGLLRMEFTSDTSWAAESRIDEIRGACPKIGALLMPLHALAPEPLPAQATPPLPSSEPTRESWWRRNRTWVTATGLVAGALGAYLLLRPSRGGYSEVRPELR